MTGLILLKTRPQNLRKVIELQQHALHGELTRVNAGDLLLLAEMRSQGAARVTYAMWFKRQRPAAPGEAERIWNDANWSFIVEGEGCRALDIPFVPEEEKVTAVSYGPGGTVVYVAPEDAHVFEQRGFLKPFR